MFEYEKRVLFNPLVWSIFADRSAFSILATVYVVYYNLNFYPFLENHKNIKTQHYVKFQYSG